MGLLSSELSRLHCGHQALYPHFLPLGAQIGLSKESFILLFWWQHRVSLMALPLSKPPAATFPSHGFPEFAYGIKEGKASLVTQTERIRMQCGRPGFSPWIGKIPWRREWLPTPVFQPRKFHGEGSLAGYSPWGCRVGRDWATFTFTFQRRRDAPFPEVSYLLPTAHVAWTLGNHSSCLPVLTPDSLGRGRWEATGGRQAPFCCFLVNLAPRVWPKPSGSTA